MRRLFACAISALVISGCDRPTDLVGPEDPLEGRTASADQIVDLGTLGGTWAVAMDINNRGEVVGFSETASGGGSAFIWTRQNGMTALPGLGTPVAINNHGQVVGYGFGREGYVWSREAGARAIPTLSDADADCFNNYCTRLQFQPSDINDHGQVVLYNWLIVYVWSSATGGTTPIPFCGREFLAYGINNLGQVVGEADWKDFANWEIPGSSNRGYDPKAGVLWDPETDSCRVLENAGWLATNAVAINDDGVVAGEGSAVASSFSYQRNLSGLPSPLRVTSAGGFDFSLLGTLGGYGGYTAGVAGTNGTVAGSGEAVNDRGDIAGFSYTASGARHAFVWTHNGGMKDLGTLGGAESVAMGINAKGDVAGWSLDAAGNRRAVLWTKSGGSIPKSSGVASHASFNLAPAPAKSFEVASCPGRLGMLVEIGALERCPVRDREARQ